MWVFSRWCELAMMPVMGVMMGVEGEAQCDLIGRLEWQHRNHLHGS